MADEPLRIGTRGSRLALAQSRLVGEWIVTAGAYAAFKLVTLSTRGDREAGPLAAIGGKGLFTAELEAALREGRIDVAVHSAKDMPAEMDPDLMLSAIPARGDCRDALVSRYGPLGMLPSRARVGTGSPRRAAQIRRARPDVRVEAIRGNVETRLGRALGEEADLDAVVLAMAGLERGGLLAEDGACVHALPVEQIMPAAGQGTLAVQSLRSRGDLAESLAALDNADARRSLLAERAVVSDLGANCQSCLAVLARPTAEGWEVRTFAARPDGSRPIQVGATGDTAQSAVATVIERLHAADAATLLRGEP